MSVNHLQLLLDYRLCTVNVNVHVAPCKAATSDTTSNKLSRSHKATRSESISSQFGTSAIKVAHP